MINIKKIRRKHMKVYKPYIFLLLVIIVFFTFFFINYRSQKITIQHPFTLNEEWTFNGSTISLPTHVNVEKGEPYTIYKTLDENFHEPQTIMIRTSLQNVIITVDDVVIYEKIYGESFDQPYASMWHFVKLPRHIDGQELSITLSSPYQDMSGEINSIFYGTEVMHYTYLVRTYGLRLFIGLFVLIIGLAVMISNFFYVKKQEKGFVFLGLFAILLSLWILAESRMLQFFTGSELLLGTLAYLVLPLFLIPLIKYVEDYILIGYRNILSPFKYVLIVHFFVVAMLHFLGIYDFFETVFMTQIWIFITLLVMIVLLFIDLKQNENKQASKFMKTFLILAVFAAFEFIGFIFNDFHSTALYLSIGILILTIGMLINYGKYFITRFKLSYESEIYEKLAFMDYVTQGYNRLAFERDLDELYKDEEMKKHLRLIVFDLDNLKNINDQYGHAEGDQAIKKAYTIMSEIYKDKGLCYRIGGDEFACIINDHSESYYFEKQKELEQRLLAFENETPYHFGLSFGSAVVSHKDMTAKDLIHDADQNMYRYKKQHKAHL